jgi:hypothetical protein
MGETYNIQVWREHEKGGHFAAWELSEHLAADLAEFYRKASPVASHEVSHAVYEQGSSDEASYSIL